MAIQLCFDLLPRLIFSDMHDLLRSRLPRIVHELCDDVEVIVSKR